MQSTMYQLFGCWSKRVLSPIGKLVVIKTLALSKLNHLILGIPNPSIEKINLIQTMFFKFLWNNSNDKVKRNVITQDYKFGGLKMVDLKMFMYSLKATWLRRLANMNNKFSNMVEFTCRPMKDLYKYGNDYIKQQMKRDINPFWKDVLFSYYSLSHAMKITYESQSYSIPLWYNENIKVGGKSVMYRHWLAAGVVFVGDLVNKDGEFYSYREFLNMFNIATNFIEYNGILAAIRHFFQIKNIDYLPRQSYNPPIPMAFSIILKDKKGCKSIYRVLLGKQENPKSLQKWKGDLANFPESQIKNNESIYDLVFKVTKDPKIHWFQFRINHRILGTNYSLKKMNLVAEDTCTFCNNAPETIVHLLWSCDLSNQFWTNLENYIKDLCNLNFQSWNARDILLGNLKLDIVLNIILLHAKLFLYYNKMKKQKPSIEAFKKRLCQVYQVERYRAKKCLKFTEFEAQWEKYKPLV